MRMSAFALVSSLASLACKPGPSTTSTAAAAEPEAAAEPREPPSFESLPEQARAVLDAAERVEVVALDAVYYDMPEVYAESSAWIRREHEAGKLDLALEGTFPGAEIGYGVVARRTLDDPDAIAAVLDALAHDLAGGGPMADCFDPRQGLRIEAAGQTLTVLICYECGRVELRTGDWSSMREVGGGAVGQLLQSWGVPACRPDRKRRNMCAEDPQ